MATDWPLCVARIDEGTVAYVDQGDPQAEPVVLLHGYPGKAYPLASS